MNNSTPLLTIGIPTYNRAYILNISLEKLLPQIDKHKNDVEIIISDNASTDHTQEIVNYHKNKFPEINFITNLQPFNTGYYGNFKKCKEMSKGKYFWLLSDNEHVFNNIIEFVITQINNLKQSGAFYFHNNENDNALEIEESNFDDIKEKHKEYSLMLVSSIIMLNEKTYDDLVINEFKDNSFLGFLFFCNAMRINKRIYVIKGSVFESYPCSVHFNIFKSWTEDISACVDYMISNNILNTETKEFFITGFLYRVVYHHVYLYRVFEKLQGKSYGSVKQLKLLLDNFYSENPYYQNNIVPLFYQKRIKLIVIYYMNKIRRKINRELKILAKKLIKK